MESKAPGEAGHDGICIIATDYGSAYSNYKRSMESWADREIVITDGLWELSVSPHYCRRVVGKLGIGTIRSVSIRTYDACTALMTTYSWRPDHLAGSGRCLPPLHNTRICVCALLFACDVLVFPSKRLA